MSSFRCSGLGIASESDSTGEEKGHHYTLSLDTLRDFCRHSRVHLYGSDMLCFFENADRQISSTGTDFQDFVRGTEIRLERYQLGNTVMYTSGVPCLRS